MVKRWKGRRAQPTDDDWMQDVPPAPAAAPGLAAAQHSTSGSHGEESRWHLRVVDGPDAGRQVPLGTQARLGRSSDNDVHLADPQASRQHAVMRRMEGSWILDDLGSSNGTFVAGNRIAAPSRLQAGDTFRIGNTTLQLVVTSATPESRSTLAAAGGANFCPHCGHALMAGTRFCTACGTPLDGADVTMPAGAPSGEPVVGVLSFVERRKGLIGSESFNVVLTADRLVFARVTSEMLKAAVEQARQDAKVQGKGFFGQWGAQLGASRHIAERYYHMPVEAILRENPDNFQLPLGQIQKVQVKHGRLDDQQSNPDYLLIRAGSKMRFNLKGVSAGEAKKALRQVLGDRVK